MDIKFEDSNTVFSFELRDVTIEKNGKSEYYIIEGKFEDESFKRTLVFTEHELKKYGEAFGMIRWSFNYRNQR